MDGSPNPSENENPEARLSHFLPFRCKKWLPGLVEETADALMFVPTKQYYMYAPAHK
jgi:hypothetical protein